MRKSSARCQFQLVDFAIEGGVKEFEKSCVTQQRNFVVGMLSFNKLDSGFPTKLLAVPRDLECHAPWNQFDCVLANR